MEESLLKARDGYELSVHLFEVKNAKAVIQLIHGMEEHQERYEPFISFLNANGFTVVSSDMRGHGRTAKDLGFFKEKKGYIELVEDQKVITEFIKKRFASLPVYIFAHSMGTIIARVLLQKNSSNYDKVVLSGYPCYQSAANLGILVAGTIKMFCGPMFKSKFINRLSVGAFNKNIKNPKTPVDWISHNEENVKAYLSDPYCGIGFTCSAFSDLFHLVKLMHQPKKYKNVNKDLQLLLLRGVDDPCVGGDKGAIDSKNVLEKSGFKNIKSIDYENMRHEILNEKENSLVYADCLSFFRS